MELLIYLRIHRCGHDLDIGKCVGDGVDPGLRHQQGHEVDVVLGHVVVQQHADGHHGRRPRGHRGVHQDHLVVLDVLIKSFQISGGMTYERPCVHLWQSEVIQLGLPGVPVGLDQDFTDPDILADLRNTCVSDTMIN